MTPERSRPPFRLDFDGDHFRVSLEVVGDEILIEHTDKLTGTRTTRTVGSPDVRLLQKRLSPFPANVISIEPEITARLVAERWKAATEAGEAFDLMKARAKFWARRGLACAVVETDQGVERLLGLPGCVLWEDRGQGSFKGQRHDEADRQMHEAFRRWELAARRYQDARRALVAHFRKISGEPFAEVIV